MHGWAVRASLITTQPFLPDRLTLLKYKNHITGSVELKSTRRNGRFNSLASSLRQNGMGWVSMMARIGAMVAPMVLLTGDYIPWLPGLIYGGAPILSGVAAIFLPETLGSPLPDTIQDVEDRWERTPCRLWSDLWCKWVNNHAFLFCIFSLGDLGEVPRRQQRRRRF